MPQSGGMLLTMRPPEAMLTAGGKVPAETRGDTVRQTTACLLAIFISTAALPGRTATSKPTTRTRDTQGILRRVVFPKKKFGLTVPAAVILAPASDPLRALTAKWRSGLIDRGFAVFTTSAPPGGWIADDAGRLIEEFDGMVDAQNLDGSWAIGRKIKPDRFLVVAQSDSGPTAISLVDKHPKRVAGALLLSVSPWVHGRSSIKLWRPGKKAWSVPIWASVPVEIDQGAPVLLLWRKVAAAKPKGALLMVDPRLKQGDKGPDSSVDQWLAEIVAGQRPSPRPDNQVVQETKRYRGRARQLTTAMRIAPAADAGEEFAKSEGPMSVKVTAPDAWQRAKRGERKYDRTEMPYVQLYLTPRPGSVLFARVNAAKWSGDAAGLLDSYEKRLARGGYLTIRYRRWTAKGYTMQISSILWPTRGKWHRWLVLAAAGKGGKDSPAAPLVLVMDASDRPNVRTMAAAVKRIMGSVSVSWRGEPTTATKPADR